MPDQRLQRMKLHEPRILLHTENHQRPDESGERHQQMRQHRHRPLILRRRFQPRYRTRLARHSSLLTPIPE